MACFCFRGWCSTLPHGNGPTCLPAPREETTSSFMAGTMYSNFYLAYDPMVSPQHYEVFLIPTLKLDRPPNSSEEEEEEHLEQPEPLDLSAEWPPSPYTTHVFSSRKWRWEERSFIRQWEPAGTIADMVCSNKDRCQAVYFRGALYVHCQNDSVMRIALLDDKYQMIKSPAVAGSKLFGEYPRLSYLGKSEKGVYSALFGQDDGDSDPWFRVWLLDERFGHPEWVLKSSISLVDNIISLHYFDSRYSKPWTVDYNKEAPTTEDEPDEWDFDDGIVLKTTPDKSYRQYHYMVFQGFHPYKEIVFFCVSFRRALSYHLNTVKVQDLGPLCVTELESSFPYTACWMRELFDNN